MLPCDLDVSYAQGLKINRYGITGYTVIEFPGLRGIRWVESGIAGYVERVTGFRSRFWEH